MDSSALHGPKRCLYSPEVMKALTISAFTKLPLNWFSLVSQKSTSVVRILRIVRVPPQVTTRLHQHECPVELSVI